MTLQSLPRDSQFMWGFLEFGHCTKRSGSQCHGIHASENHIMTMSTFHRHCDCVCQGTCQQNTCTEGFKPESQEAEPITRELSGVEKEVITKFFFSLKYLQKIFKTFFRLNSLDSLEDGRILRDFPRSEDSPSLMNL